MPLGIADSLVAGFFGRLLGLYARGQRAGFILSAFGAISPLALSIDLSLTGNPPLMNRPPGGWLR
jgi:hypothetical protein